MGQLHTYCILGANKEPAWPELSVKRSGLETGQRHQRSPQTNRRAGDLLCKRKLSKKCELKNDML